MSKLIISGIICLILTAVFLVAGDNVLASIWCSSGLIIATVGEREL